MDKNKQHPLIAAIGQIPDDFLINLNKLNGIIYFSEPQLTNISTEALSHLRILVIGQDVNIHTLSMWLPSLRTANSTMSVVAIGSESKSKRLVNWVDDFVLAPEELELYLRSHLSNEGLSESMQSALTGTKKVVIQILVFCGLLSLWWGVTTLFNPPKYLLPSPVQVAEAFMSQWDRYLMHLVVTAKEAILGFSIGNFAGISLAIIMHRFFHLQKWTMPVLISFQAIPIVAFAPLLSVWLGTGLASKITMAAIICFFPMVVNSLVAFSAVEKEYLELFKLFDASYIMKFKRLLLPASAPSIIAALKISAGLSVVGAIVAEMTGADTGLGYLLLNGAYRLETDLMFVAMLLSGLLGVIFFHMPDTIRIFLPKTWMHGLADETSSIK